MKYKKWKVAILVLLNCSIFSYGYSREEIIFQIKIGGKIEYLEGYIDTETEELYASIDSFLDFIETPLELKEKLKKEYKEGELLNITDLNINKKIKFDKFNWNEFDSILEVDPPWETEEENESKILRSREQLNQRKYTNGKEEVEREKWKLFTPGILNVGFSRDDITHDSENRFYFNYTNNFLYGNLNLDGDVKDDGSHLNYSYWQRDIIDEKKLIIGDFYRSSVFNYGKSERLRGIQLLEKYSWNSNISVNSKSIIGFAESGSTVELYVNNILRDFQIVQGGQYRFDVDLGSGSNEYTIKKYGTNGEVVQEKVSIYGSENILKIGEFDYIGSVGHERDEDFNIYDIQLRYGLLENLTIGVGGFNVIDNNSEIREFVSISEIGSFNIPYINIPILQEGHLGYKSEDEFAYRYNIETMINAISISYFNENYSKLDERLKETINRVKNSELQLSKDIFGINTRLGYNDSKDRFEVKQKEYYVNLGKGFGKIYTNLGVRRNDYKKGYEKDNTSYNFGTSYSFSNGISKYMDIISAYMDTDDIETTWGFSLGKNSGNSEWDYSLTYNYNKRFGENYSLSVSYTPGKTVNIQTGVYREKNSIKRISSSVETNVYLGGKGPNLGYSDFTGNGSVTGKSFIDKNGDGKFNEDEEWIKAIIKSDSTEIYNRYNGKYILGGLQTYRPSRLTGELNGQELPYNIEPNLKKVIQLNPGGLMQVNFPFRPKVTAISTIDFENEVYYEEVTQVVSNLKIQLKNLNNSQEVIVLSWNEDNVFISDLAVGEYEVKLIQPKNSNIKLKMNDYILKVEDEMDLSLNFKGKKDGDNSFEFFLEKTS